MSTLVKTVAATIAAITGWYALTLLKIDADRDRRRSTIAAAISSLRKDAATPMQNKATLDSLASVGLSEHLEPLVIRGLVGFVGSKTRNHDCRKPLAVSSDSLRLQRANIDQSLQLIRVLQRSGHARHSYPDRVIDASLAMWHGEQDPSESTIRFDAADLRGVNLREMELASASFVGACLWKARLDSAQLSGASFQQAHLDSAALDRATLDQTSFVRASLRGTSLQNAQGRGTNFDRSDLTGADLTGVRFDSANLHAATLSCATLGNSVLTRAYVSGAILHWAYLGGDSLIDVQRWNEVRGFRGALLTDVKGLSESQLKFARDSGAVPDTIDQLAWTERKAAQFKKGAVCGVQRN